MLTYFIVSTLGLLLEMFSEYIYYPTALTSYYISLPIGLAGMPILFFYIKSLTDQSFKFNKKLIIHFIPAIAILLINIITLTLSPLQEKTSLIEVLTPKLPFGIWLTFYIKTYFFTQLFIYNIQIFLYCVLIFRILLNHQKNIKNYFSYTEKISLDWLKVFIITFIIFSFIDIIGYLFGLRKFSPETYSIISFFSISFLGYASIWQKQIYPSSINNPTEVSQEIVKSIDITSDLKPDINKKQIVSEEYVFKKGELIHLLMIEQKPYLKSNLMLEDLSIMLNIHRNILSKVINDHFHMNFFNLINKYRIEESALMLKNKEYNHLSIEGIALTVGFNSKSVFNPAFKKHFGQTPSEYRQKNLS